jgi:hypothetical protein
VLGVLLGSGMLIHQALTLQGAPYPLVVVHTHLLTVGFLVNMVMGVAYWLFPRPSGRPEQRLASAAYGCLNGGLVLRFATEPFLLAPGGPWFQAGAALAGLLQGLAALLFLAGVWGRVMSPRERLEQRETEGR